MSENAETRTHTEKGISLARGPALILGTIVDEREPVQERQRVDPAAIRDRDGSGVAEEPVGARRR